MDEPTERHHREAAHQLIDDFQSYRPLLFAIAYRMLGGASDAEDVVQETYLRCRATPAHKIRSPKAYLSMIVTRVCLDELKSARRAREEYIGPWLPEPLLTSDVELTPLQTVEQRESISMAFLVLLERLTPQERAVFLLREVFGYSYQEIAEIVGTSLPSCRQLFHRAKERIAGGQRRFAVSPDVQRGLVEQFLAACQRGDLQALSAALAHDVTAWSDSGGKVSAARRPVQGRDAIVRFVLGLMRKAYADIRFTFEEVNGGPEVLTAGQMAQAWLAARGLRRRIIDLPLPVKAADGFRRGYNTCPEHVGGVVTWAEWLRRSYGSPKELLEASV